MNTHRSHKGNSARLLFCLLLIALFLPLQELLADPSLPPWREFSSAEGRFTVLFPGVPTASHKSENTPVGPLEEYIFEKDVEGMEFSAAYQDLPSIAALFGSKKTIYRKAKEGLLKDAKGKELAFGTRTVDGFFGSELSFEAPAGKGKARFLMQGRRLYVIVAIGKGTPPDALISKFLDSFQLIKETPPDHHVKHRSK